MFEDIFSDILDEVEDKKAEDEEKFDENREFSIFSNDEEPREVEDFWSTGMDQDIWSTDEVWDTSC